jgi:hypothetical protein
LRIKVIPFSIDNAIDISNIETNNNYKEGKYREIIILFKPLNQDYEFDIETTTL